jgi:hypothetical protein
MTHHVVIERQRDAIEHHSFYLGIIGDHASLTSGSNRRGVDREADTRHRFSLFRGSHASVVVRANRHRQLGAQDDFRKARHAVFPADRSGSIHLELRELHVRYTCDRSKRKQEARLDGCEQEVLRTPRIPRTVVLGLAVPSEAVARPPLTALQSKYLRR